MLTMRTRKRSNPNLPYLAQLPIFRSCTAKQLSALLRNTDIIDVPAGTVIDRSGTFAQQFVGIVDGYVGATDVDGNTRLLGCGDHIGAAELLHVRPHRATYTTTTASSLVVVFGPAFRVNARSLPLLLAPSNPVASRPRRDRLTLVG